MAPVSFTLSNRSASVPRGIFRNPFRERNNFRSMKKVPPITQSFRFIFLFHIKSVGNKLISNNFGPTIKELQMKVFGNRIDFLDSR